MSACPTCGVAVVPGYVKCPKCGKPLPAVARTKSASMGGGGGTAVVDREPANPRTLYMALGAGALVAVVLVFVLGGGSPKKTARAATTDTEEVADEPAPEPTPAAPRLAPAGPMPTPPVVPTEDRVQSATTQLDRELKRRRLWGTVSIVASRVDIRSGACEDAGMGQMIDALRGSLSGAGLTKLRCLSQSGAVVYERDL